MEMRLLDRYLLRELLVPLGYCLGGFFVFWVAFDLFQELDKLQANQLRFGDIVEFYCDKSPELFVVVLPIALLLAALYALTNHARHHEITAIRAAGVSVWRLAAPYLVVGLTASVGLLVLNELVAPDASAKAEEILLRRTRRSVTEGERDLVRNQGFNNERDRRVWQFAVYNLRTGEMRDAQVIWSLPDGSQRWLKADRAVRTNGEWMFYNAREFRSDPQTNTGLLPSLQTNVLARAQFTETTEEIRSELKISRLGLSGTRQADVPLSEIFDYLRFHPNPSPEKRDLVFTKLHGRLAVPWTCLVVVLIALPFGAASGRRNVFVGVASSVFICFAFFILSQVGLALGTGGFLPAWLAGWFPNLTFGIAGVWLTARAR